MIRLMEVCGTHTMAIAKSGIRQLLPPEVRLISGPGCPVCVTSPGTIDCVLSLTEIERDLIITTYGDMIRVPGSLPGDTLMKRKAAGADVRVVYSPMDALNIAIRNPEKQVVFLGVGFETTAPGTAAAVASAQRNDIRNFTVFSMLKRMEPAIRKLVMEPGFSVQGFLCPGHVAVVTGERGMEFISKDLHYPAVISGFEPDEIMKAISLLLRQIRQGEALLQNAYGSVVSHEGNTLAREMMERVLTCRKDCWRGLGDIEDSGFGLRSEYEAFDAEKRFALKVKEPEMASGCRCGEVIRGELEPGGCPMFGKACLPEEPVGPCMVSSEGACAAAWKYRDVGAL